NSIAGQAITFNSQPNLGAGVFVGDFAEIIIYDHALTPADRDAVTAYLTTKYAIVLNPPPVASSQSVTTAENTPVGITLVATQSANHPLAYTVASPPVHGTLSGTAPNLTYTPAANYYGPDSFTFTAQDGAVSSNTALVSIMVVQPPVAANQSVTTTENAAVGITLAATQINNDALGYVVASSPVHGTLSGTAPNLTYTPAANYYGPDSFTFTANDGAVGSNVGTVSITVTKVNYPPVAFTQSVTTTQNAPVVITLTATQTNNDPLAYMVQSPPAHGTLSGMAPNLTYTPATNYYGADNFTFTANDSTVASNAATVSITVMQIPAVAPVFSSAGHAVAITSVTSGATIRYTTDGSTPTEANGTVYSGPVSISTPITLKAMAYGGGFLDSPVISATIGITTITITTPANGSTINN
ncbi:MAG TPA: Ig-like domain-containing protein, partial [Opitutaceae bacterium]|nr:Ig-like domain-containing protein [Opitutaceae bacterium]